MNQTVHLCVSYSDEMFSINNRWSFNQDKESDLLKEARRPAAEEVLNIIILLINPHLKIII